LTLLEVVPQSLPYLQFYACSLAVHFLTMLRSWLMERRMAGWLVGVEL